MAGAAKSIGVRDAWIGWSKGQRLNNLPWVVNNTRFLIFDWVRVKHLTSHILGQLSMKPGIKGAAREESKGLLKVLEELQNTSGEPWPELKRIVAWLEYKVSSEPELPRE